MTVTAAELRPADPRRRLAELARERFHLICPVCEWIVQPADGLMVDRTIRLLEHLVDPDHGPPGLAELRNALAYIDRPTADTFYPTGEAW